MRVYETVCIDTARSYYHPFQRATEWTAWLAQGAFADPPPLACTMQKLDRSGTL